MEIKYTIQDDKLEAVLSGELDEYNAPHVRLSLDTLLKDIECIKNPKLILDFSGVTFMDSTGIGVLLGRFKKFSKSNVKIFIKNAKGHVDRILEMTGIYGIMPKLS